MTVIVKPSAPLTADDIVSEYLTRLLGTLDFVSFAQVPSGEITLLDITFKMRVGKFLGVPTGAIIAAEQFVKMKSDPSLEGYDLGVLDPKNPDACLYDDHQGSKTWRPPAPAAQSSPAGVQQMPSSAYGHYEYEIVGRQSSGGGGPAAYAQQAYAQAQAAAMKRAHGPPPSPLYQKPTFHGTIIDEDDRDTRSWWQKLAGV